MFLQGIILRAVGGFYDVRTADGKTYRCRARGRLKKVKMGLLAGDRVRFSVTAGAEGVVEEIYPRQTLLFRPPVANVEQVMLVGALQDPPLSLQLLDRLLVLAASRRLHPLICFNKADLPHAREDIAELLAIYKAAGYTVFVTSAKTGLGIGELRAALCGRISVLAGPSGAGKSSLINRIQPGLSLKVGGISEKSKRGRHTTRHVELLSLDCGGFVADTPGFSQLELLEIKSRELSAYFPEFAAFAAQCRFHSCLHAGEPDCAVSEAVARQEIAASRYEHYLLFLQETREQERSF
ncbi:MAG: ribosome small subunit-dependent GTPase A [Firmicutes bacterium]|nr:ribosome small subunit-dependent GTPase A [Bacillota bacterium]